MQIAADSIVGDKIYLHFYLALRPRVSTINYIGVKKSEREDLETKLGLLKGMRPLQAIRSARDASARPRNKLKTIINIQDNRHIR